MRESVGTYSCAPPITPTRPLWPLCKEPSRGGMIFLRLSRRERGIGMTGSMEDGNFSRRHDVIVVTQHVPGCDPSFRFDYYHVAQEYWNSFGTAVLLKNYNRNHLREGPGDVGLVVDVSGTPDNVVSGLLIRFTTFAVCP